MQLELGQPLQQRARELDPLADRHDHVGVLQPLDKLIEIARRLAIALHVVVRWREPRRRSSSWSSGSPMRISSSRCASGCETQRGTVLERLPELELPRAGRPQIDFAAWPCARGKSNSASAPAELSLEHDRGGTHNLREPRRCGAAIGRARCRTACAAPTGYRARRCVSAATRRRRPQRPPATPWRRPRKSCSRPRRALPARAADEKDAPCVGPDDLARMKPTALIVKHLARRADHGRALAALAGAAGYTAVNIYEEEPIVNGDHPFPEDAERAARRTLGWAEWDNFKLFLRMLRADPSRPSGPRDQADQSGRKGE